MTREEKQKAIDALKTSAPVSVVTQEEFNDYIKTLNKIMDWLEQEHCNDCISRQYLLDNCIVDKVTMPYVPVNKIEKAPPVTLQTTGHCKECKYFEYDSVVEVDGIPLIVAHNICSKWGYGCKTKEDGYCFLFKPKESKDDKK